MMTKQEILEACINEELKFYGIDYNFVKNNPQIYQEDNSTQDWFNFYTFTSKNQFESWKSFCISLFRKELKQSKKQAEREFDWLNLMFGLKQEYVEKN